jgi:hypothetical protein
MIYWPAVTLTGNICLWLMIGGIVVAMCCGKRPTKPSEEQFNNRSESVAVAPTVSEPPPIVDTADTMSRNDITANAEPPSAAEATSASAPVAAVAPPRPELIDPFADDTPAPAPNVKRARGAPACKRYGTAVDFVDNPTDAAQQALREKKLLFVLNVAGNFEDDKFT